MTHRIEHAAIVEAATSGLITVRLNDGAVCEQCRLGAVCGSDGQNRITVEVPPGEVFEIGQKVRVGLRQPSQWAAVWWGVGCPSLLLLLVIGASWIMALPQIVAAVIAVVMTAIYFAILFVNGRHKASVAFWAIID